MDIKWKTKQDITARLTSGVPSITISGHVIPAEIGLDSIPRVVLTGNMSDCQTFGVAKIKNYDWRIVLLHSGMVLAQAFKTSKDAKTAASELADLDIDWSAQSPAELVASSPSIADYAGLVQTIEQVCGTGYFTPSSR